MNSFAWKIARKETIWDPRYRGKNNIKIFLGEEECNVATRIENVRHCLRCYTAKKKCS